MSFSYLANPYSHPDPAVRARRFEAVCEVARALMVKGEVVFSPIAHSHPIDPDGVLGGYDFWIRQDAPYLEACSRLIVLMLDGWDQSRGVAHEIRRAVERGIPIEYMEAK